MLVRDYLTMCAAGCIAAGNANAQSWVVFNDETSMRLIAAAGVGSADPEEKDYDWGDLDQDGDIDLVCVRKQPYTSAGRRTNVLFMNEGKAEGHAIDGVLVDRTAQYATASDAPLWDDPQVPGGVMPDQGFLQPTNDRDVVVVDVNNDTWLDMVTAATISINLPNHIGHPRVYINLGEIKGVWQGFRYESNRIPFLGPPAAPTAQPRFGSVAAGDLTGDGYVDLHFTDYDSNGAGGGPEPPAQDYNNKLLINEGAANPGYFVDSGTTRMSANPGLLSAFGASNAIADMNGDGFLDVVKQTALNQPQHVAVQYNDPNNQGYFPDALYKITTPILAPYFVSAGDLNNDGRLDMVISDNNADRYHLNQGNAADGTAIFSNHNFSFQVGSDDGFGEDSLIIDLDNNGFNDVLISDIDPDIGGCSRRTHIYRNLGNVPNVTLQEQPPPVIPNSQLSGTHDIAVFDINGDGWKDIVLGRCVGNRIWINQPPCPADVTDNEQVNIEDLFAVIAAWGPCPPPCPPCSADVNNDCEIDIDDLFIVIAAWGPCL